MRTLAQAVRACAPNAAGRTMTAGFDGFVDTLVRPVCRVGTDGQADAYFETIADFGAYLCAHAGKSCSVELAVESVRAGGNLPQIADAAGGLGLDTVCIGTLGADAPDPLFADVPARLYAFAPPGQSTALEFRDGKVFLAPRFTLPGDPWALAQRAADGQADALFARADVCALVNWSELPFAQALWQAVFDHAFADAPADKGRYAFFDLCDCARRAPEEIAAVLRLIGRFAGKRTAVLSMNENEAHTVSDAVLDGERALPAIGKALRARFGIDEVLIHTLRETVLCAARGMVREAARFVEQPVRSTGAGDHFNGAFCFASVVGLTGRERVQFANRYVHSYLTHGYGPTLPALLAELEAE